MALNNTMGIGGLVVYDSDHLINTCFTMLCTNDVPGPHPARKISKFLRQGYGFLYSAPLPTALFPYKGLSYCSVSLLL